MKDLSILRLLVFLFAFSLKSLFLAVSQTSILDRKWHDLGSLKSVYLKKFLIIFFSQKFAERRQIDARRGMPSFALILVMPRTLFTKNRGGVRIRPPRRFSLFRTCIRLILALVLIANSCGCDASWHGL